MEGHWVAVCEETALSATGSPVRAPVGGLAYYTGRRITLLEPPGFVPPTYLAGRSGGGFLSRAALQRRWRGRAGGPPPPPPPPRRAWAATVPPPLLNPPPAL